MTDWHGYFAIENINLNASQRQTLRNEVIGFFQEHQQPTRQPAELLHWRLSLDATKVILEAKFDDALLTVNRFKTFLGNVFSIDPATIDHNITTPGNNTVMTLSRNGTDYLRFALFGGVNSTYDESHITVLVYLDNNREEWDETP